MGQDDLNTAIQYVADATGNTVAVIVPIDLWNDLLAEQETAYLLSSEPMRQRLLDARQRQTGISLEEACETLRI